MPGRADASLPMSGISWWLWLPSCLVIITRPVHECAWTKRLRPMRRSYVLLGRRPKPDVGNLTYTRRMRLYRQAGWTYAHATRPPKSGDRVCTLEFPRPASRLSREAGVFCAPEHLRQAVSPIGGELEAAAWRRASTCACRQFEPVRGACRGQAWPRGLSP